jgi:Leucine-rich repeat (LRR) protein
MKISCIDELKKLDNNNYKDIEVITIFSEDITDIDFNVIFQCINVTELNLIKNNIYNIPYEIENLSQLKILIINFNFITKLPTTIIKLQNLISLGLENNYLEHIQEEICELSNLQFLRVSNNNIYDIPSYITKLNHVLRLLDIGNIDNNGYYIDYNWHDDINKLNKLAIANFIPKENNITYLPNEVALLRFLVNFYCNDLKNHIIIYDNNMTIIDLPTANFESLVIPDNITDLLIIHTNPNGQKINNLIFDNLPYQLEYLRIVSPNTDFNCSNLPTQLHGLYIYTAPYCRLHKPYSHWPQPLLKEDIYDKIKIPFDCEVYYNDEQICV